MSSASGRRRPRRRGRAAARRVAAALEAELPVDPLRQLAGDLGARPPPDLVERLLVAAAALPGGLLLHEVGHVEVRVPRLERGPPGEVAHGGAVGGGAALGRRRGGLASGAVLLGGDGHAGDEPLDVPLPRRRQRLVEVVDVEDQAPLRRREDAEVGDVRVADGLHAQPGDGRRRQVGGHHGGGAAQKGERRRRHAPVADGQQVLLPVRPLFHEDLDGVPPVRRGLVGGEVATACDGPSLPCPSLSMRWHPWSLLSASRRPARGISLQVGQQSETVVTPPSAPRAARARRARSGRPAPAARSPGTRPRRRAAG